jgi:hypothetical protein
MAQLQLYRGLRLLFEHRSNTTDSDTDDSMPPLEDIIDDSMPPLEDIIDDSMPPLEDIIDDSMPPLEDIIDDSRIEPRFNVFNQIYYFPPPRLTTMPDDLPLCTELICGVWDYSEIQPILLRTWYICNRCHHLSHIDEIMGFNNHDYHLYEHYENPPSISDIIIRSIMNTSDNYEPAVVSIIESYM